MENTNSRQKDNRHVGITSVEEIYEKRGCSVVTSRTGID